MKMKKMETARGANPEATPAKYPRRIGQTSDMTLRPGQVGELGAIFIWPNGKRKTVIQKVALDKGPRRVYTIYPPIDPDDMTSPRQLDAEPAIFVVDGVKSE